MPSVTVFPLESNERTVHDDKRKLFIDKTTDAYMVKW